MGEAEDGGQNIVCMNTTDVAVYESSVSATNNSWRSLEDPPGVFEVYDGDLDYAHWLPPDPNCGGSSAPVAVGKSVLEAESMGGLPPVIRTILEKRRRGLYDDALRMIRALLTDRSTTREAKRRVLGQLLAVGQRTRGGDLSGFLTRLRQSEPLFTRQVSGLLPAVYLHEGSPEAALAACEANIREYPGSSLARGGWYGKFTHALYLRHDTVEARRVLERLQEGFAGSVQAEMAQLQLNTIRRVMVSARAEGTASGMAKGTNAAPGIPAEFALSQNYPNPFNPTTTMRFELPEPARVSLTVYDVLGRVVETLLDETKEAGYHTVRWNAGARSSGVYLARFIATTAAGTVALQQTLKLVLAK